MGPGKTIELTHQRILTIQVLDFYTSGSSNTGIRRSVDPTTFTASKTFDSSSCFIIVTFGGGGMRHATDFSALSPFSIRLKFFRDLLIQQ